MLASLSIRAKTHHCSFIFAACDDGSRPDRGSQDAGDQRHCGGYPDQLAAERCVCSVICASGTITYRNVIRQHMLSETLEE